MNLVNVVAGACTLAMFAWLAIRRFRMIHSPADFFHNDRLSSNVVSLTAANLTLGSGVAYLISGGFQQGAILYLAPVGLFVGYWLLAKLLGRGLGREVEEEGNFLAGVDRAIRVHTGRRSWFGPVVAWSLVVAYLLFIAFEVYASSTLIAPLFFDGPGVSSTIILASILFGVTLFYAVTGGILGVFRTDKAQLTAAILLVVALLATVLAPISIDGEKTGVPARVVTWSVALAALSATIAAVATQFYSLLNWASVSHVQVRDQQSLLIKVGLLSAILLAMILTVGVLLPSPPDGLSPVQYVLQRFNALVDQLGQIGFVLSIVLVVGALSIMVSTVDSLLLAIVMFIYDMSGRSSKATEPGPAELRRIRVLAIACLSISFAAMLAFQIIQTNIFYLLLSIAGMMVVFAPMLALTAYLSRDTQRLVVFSRGVVCVYLALYAMAFAFSIWAALRYPALAAWTGTIAFAVSLTWSAIVLHLANRFSERASR
ncbi:MAG: hypothetical protein KAY37_10975 [Phycisphaerae bacterium]|nr:hypothetical protein [Phycisphaerae bacterium]